MPHIDAIEEMINNLFEVGDKLNYTTGNVAFDGEAYLRNYITRLDDYFWVLGLETFNPIERKIDWSCNIALKFTSLTEVLGFLNSAKSVHTTDMTSNKIDNDFNEVMNELKSKGYNFIADEVRKSLIFF